MMVVSLELDSEYISLAAVEALAKGQAMNLLEDR